MQAPDLQRLKELLVGLNRQSVDVLSEISEKLDHLIKEDYAKINKLYLQDFKENTHIGRKSLNVIDDQIISDSMDDNLQKINAINTKLAIIKSELTNFISATEADPITSQNLADNLEDKIDLNEKMCVQIAKLSLIVDEIKSIASLDKLLKDHHIVNSRVTVQKEMLNNFTSQLSDLMKHNQQLRANLNKENGLSSKLDSAKKIHSLDPQPPKKNI